MTMADVQPGAARTRATRVMLVDDSAVMRGFMRRVLEVDPRIDIVAAAANGKDALDQVRIVKPDVIILDIEMPVMDGITALPLLLGAHPGLKVLVASTHTSRNAALSLEAMRLGAADYVEKPERAFVPGVAQAYGGELASRIAAIAGGAPATAPAQPVAKLVPAPPLRKAPALPPEIIAIGSSTGGPPALMKVFEGLSTVRVPILITQHMPPTFTALLADTLGRIAKRPSGEAQDGEPILPGRIYVAPAGLHLTAVRGSSSVVVKLSDAPLENYCRPAVDPMLRSLATIYGRGLLALILTGMGSDGAKGCEAVAEQGGRFVVQDEKTSVVWGMPGAAARTGKAEAVLPLSEIASYVSLACRSA